MDVCELIVADHGINLFAGFSDARRVLQQVVDSAGDDTRCCAGTDGHGDDLIDDLLLIERFPSLGIFGVHHRPEHVFPISGVGTPVFKTLGGVLTHGFAVFLELGLVEEPVEDLGAGRTFHGFGGGSVHGFDHGGFWS